MVTKRVSAAMRMVIEQVSGCCRCDGWQIAFRGRHLVLHAAGLCSMLLGHHAIHSNFSVKRAFHNIGGPFGFSDCDSCWSLLTTLDEAFCAPLSCVGLTFRQDGHVGAVV